MLKIMGQAAATVQQMQAYIKKVNPKVPDSVIKMIPLYVSEGALECVEILHSLRVVLRLVILDFQDPQ